MRESPERRLERLEALLASGPTRADGISEIPSVVDFVVSPNYLNRPRLYPRQALLLKLIFLQMDQMTEYDHSVLEEWGVGSGRGLETNRAYGVPSDLLERLGLMKSMGRLWVREFIAVIGRRGSKGFIGAISTSYILYHLLATGDPQKHFGLAKGKTLTIPVFAQSKDQARDTQWRDIVDLVTDAPAFQIYIARRTADRLGLWSPAQLALPTELRISPAIELVARESTESAARGFASPVLLYDEMAHEVPSSASSSREIYQAASQAQITFGEWAYSHVSSSPRHKVGQFYELYDQALAMGESDVSVRPHKFPIQLPSWDLYNDWERAHLIERYPGGENFAALDRALVSEHDPELVELKRTNPENYRVENTSQWAEVLLQFLDPEMVSRMFMSFNGRTLKMQNVGIRHWTYVIHIDLSRVGNNTAMVVAHAEPTQDPMRPQFIVDHIRVWKPGDLLTGQIDYKAVELEVQRHIESFRPHQVTFDSWQSMAMIQNLTEFVRSKGLRMYVGELEVSQHKNLERAEAFKGALYDDRVHSPSHELAKNELLFLQDFGSKIDHPTSGPVTTNDVVVCLFAVVFALQELAADPGRLFTTKLHAMGYPTTHGDQVIFDRLSRSRSDRYPYKRLRQGKTTQERRPRGPR